jgi:hypothetical protein
METRQLGESIILRFTKEQGPGGRLTNQAVAHIKQLPTRNAYAMAWDDLPITCKLLISYVNVGQCLVTKTPGHNAPTL